MQFFRSPRSVGDSLLTDHPRCRRHKTMFGGGFPFSGFGFDGDDMPGMGRRSSEPVSSLPHTCFRMCGQTPARCLPELLWAGRGQGRCHAGVCVLHMWSFHQRVCGRQVNTTELYEVLGVEKDAEQKAIKRAYHKIAMKEHPDRGTPRMLGSVCLVVTLLTLAVSLPGGDAEKFKKAQQAYEILGKPEKRKLYDQGGLEAVERGESRKNTRRDRTRDVVRPLPCTLEEVYNGKTRRFAIHRTVLCGACTGSGCKSGKSEIHCDTCNGRGVRVVIRRMGPMIQQMQMACDDCRGEGTSIAAEDRCPSCNGNKLSSARQRKVVEVAIEKGMKDNEKITLRGMADEAPGKEAGDLVFVLQMQKHAVFKRRGADLYMDKDITLLEALTGVKFVLEHMDGALLASAVSIGLAHTKPAMAIHAQGTSTSSPRNRER